MVAKNTVEFRIVARDLASRTLRRVRGVLGDIRTRLLALVGIGALVEGGRQAAEFARQIRNLAAGVGLTTTEFQTLLNATRQYGIEADDLSDALFSVEQARSEALQGDSQQIENFRRLGISMSRLRQGDPLEFFLQFAQAVATAEDGGRSLQVFLSRLMGEDNARRLMPALRGGPEALVRDMTESLEKRTLSEDQVTKASDVLTEAQNKYQEALVTGTGLVITAAESLAQKMGELDEKVEELRESAEGAAAVLRQLGDDIRESTGIAGPAGTEASGAPLLPDDSTFSP